MPARRMPGILLLTAALSFESKMVFNLINRKQLFAFWKDLHTIKKGSDKI
jgi:hypothetical protein